MCQCQPIGERLRINFADRHSDGNPDAHRNPDAGGQPRCFGQSRRQRERRNLGDALPDAVQHGVGDGER